MRTFICACALTLGAVTQAEALLPPLYQTAEEIKGMLESPQLGHALESGEVIESIQSIEGGYRIVTNHNQVDVKISTRAQRMPGPAHFEYQFGQPKPLN